MCVCVCVCVCMSGGKRDALVVHALVQCVGGVVVWLCVCVRTRVCVLEYRFQQMLTGLYVGTL